MTPMRYLLVVLSDDSRGPWSNEIVTVAGQPPHMILSCSPQEAAQYLADNRISPSHIVLDIGARGQDVFAEVDQLAQQCEAGTRVLVVGDTNDIILYRGLLSRGIIDYLPMPAIPSEIVRLLSAPSVAAVPAAAPAVPRAIGEKRVIAFISAASGDGGSTAALNTAFALSQTSGPTILVDMDYQFGMVAKNLNLQNQYGIADLFDHPERGLDATLIKRMVASYGKLHVITAPIELRYLPTVSSEVIRELVLTLQNSYDNVIIDLPHVWLPWVAAVAQEATHLVMVALLWLKAETIAARL